MSSTAVKVCRKKVISVASFKPVLVWSENGRMAPGSIGFGTAPMGKMRQDGHGIECRTASDHARILYVFFESQRALVALFTAVRASHAVG